MLMKSIKRIAFRLRDGKKWAICKQPPRCIFLRHEKYRDQFGKWPSEQLRVRGGGGGGGGGGEECTKNPFISHGNRSAAAVAAPPIGIADHATDARTDRWTAGRTDWGRVQCSFSGDGGVPNNNWAVTIYHVCIK